MLEQNAHPEKKKGPVCVKIANFMWAGQLQDLDYIQEMYVTLYVSNLLPNQDIFGCIINGNGMTRIISDVILD